MVTFTTNGLTNGGLTTHYQFQYDTTFQGTAWGAQRTNDLIAMAEGDYTIMFNWFNNITITVEPSPIVVNITDTSGGEGATWYPVQIMVPTSASVSYIRYLLVTEVVEMFMKQQGGGWFASNEGSDGEGLSLFLGTQFLQGQGLPPQPNGYFVGNRWLSTPERADFVNNPDPSDIAKDARIGCCTLFIAYLHTQLGFDIPTICNNNPTKGSSLADVYRSLTGDTSDPFPFFKQVLDTAFPNQGTVTPAVNQDNPFPLCTVAFWVDKSTFGKDETNDSLSVLPKPGFPNSFLLVVEGLNWQVLSTATPPVFFGPASTFTGISFTPSTAPKTGPIFEGPNLLVPQRVSFPYDIGFTAASIANWPTAVLQEELDASITLATKPFNSPGTILEFIPGADPYFQNVDPKVDNLWWLSQDIRVFTATPTKIDSPVPGGPTFTNHSFTGAYSYCTQLVDYLNNTFGDPVGAKGDPFTNGTLPAQNQAYKGDSSVSPGSATDPNYNFAIARVRLRGSVGVTGQAQNVKVFFRLWQTSTADTDFLPTTYPSQVGTNNVLLGPLPSVPLHTIPFFATQNTPNFGDPTDPEYGTNVASRPSGTGVNNRTITIATGDSQWAYFGCFINVYDANNKLNGSSINSILPGGHHCIVAQIAYQGAPIPNGASPAATDKLAQRNLQVTYSNNPGSAATHLIPQTFDMRPSAVVSGAALGSGFDELMIDWGNTPVGSIASFYWPQINAEDVLALATQLYATQLLTSSDPHTIQCTVVDGYSYIPIPRSAGQNFAGLLSIDLPSTVVKGQEFNILVRRVTNSTKFIPTPPPPPSITLRTNDTGGGSTIPGNQVTWRSIVGAFQVKIPVTTAATILPDEEDLLAIFKWRLQQTSPTNRWYPVLQRYIGYISARVDGLGGDASDIPPSPNGACHRREGSIHDGSKWCGLCAIFKK